MVTLQELFDFRNNTELRNRVAAACSNAAKEIFLELETVPNHEERLTWAVAIFRDNGEGAAVTQVFRAVVVVLQDTVETALDVDVQNAVDAVIDYFATAGGA